MRRTEWLREVRKMRFEEAYGGWRGGRITQEEAARILGVSDRTFRRYIGRYDDGGLPALLDKRISQVSHLKAPVDEVMALAARLPTRCAQDFSSRPLHDSATHASPDPRILARGYDPAKGGTKNRPQILKPEYLHGTIDLLHAPCRNTRIHKERQP